MVATYSTNGGRCPRPLTARATYRLQLHRGFDLAAARAVLPYLAALGVTDCYLSPISRALPGSSHGYDVCRHSEINPELGGEIEFQRFSDEAARLGLGIVLDFVPNHMSNDPHTNEWWRDVLENGPSSPYARYFDIDWAPTKPELQNRLLLPILGEPYGDALDRGTLVLRYDSGALVLDVGDYHLPINPRRAPLVYEHDLATLEQALGSASADLREFLSVLSALRNLPAYTERDERLIAERHREKEVARGRLARVVDANSVISAHVAAAVAAFNGRPGNPRSFDRLHDLLELQPYRLASWRTAADEINYRRFFDINALAGLRVEDPQVFAAIHQLFLRLVASGTVTGVRLDHVDGLLDPGGYLTQLAAAIRVAREASGPRSPAPDQRSGPAALPFIVVEKILTGTETLRDDWAVAGTTGYTFLNLVNGVFVDGRSAARLHRLYASFTGRRESFADVAYESKRLIVSTALSSEFQVLAQAINRFSEQDRRFRDFTQASIRRALRELVACFPVYRTYVGAAGATALDAEVLDTAIADARRRNPAMESSIFDFLRFVLLPPPADAEAPGADDSLARARTAIAMRFQQYSAPVQAKGVEDTAFYRYHLLTSLNDVGGDPACMGTTVAEFHRAALTRHRHSPGEMLATTTHDTKRSEDARVRINVISERCHEWRSAVAYWRRINEGNCTSSHDGRAPDANDEYLFYQTLLGTWPTETLDAPLPARAPRDLIDRMQAFMQKAIKEAKLHTSWITPNVDYESAVARFVDLTLAGRRAGPFLTSFVPFVRTVARAGAVNSLAQLVLKLVSPGVPDFYQGTELWDLSLVDPDNRRPVDFAARQQLLTSLEPSLRAASAGTLTAEPALRRSIDTLLDRWTSGDVKLYVTALLLRWRELHPSVFTEGHYVPLATAGARARHVIALARRSGDRTVVVAVPRLTASLCGPDQWPVGAGTWRDTAISLPWPPTPAGYRCLFTGDAVATSPAGSASALFVRDVLRAWPCAVLTDAIPP